ncbi:kinase-like domain-containing protein [Xylaria cf. heliscus]|nr:kinase-like domain-containing protein [Xylaria cf. heliscus]
MSNLRKNGSKSACIRLELFAEGAFKYVYAGIYGEGPRAGQRCVSKQFKTGSVYADHYFNEEMNIIRRTQRVIDDWHHAGIIDKRILLNMPEIWTSTETGAKYLVEPMIDNFEKFNSNTGWASSDGGPWNEAMQALSHFSYHNSGGRLLLCDIQGGYYRGGYILTDPVIMSSEYETKYGPADLGPNGIRSFFYQHRCGQFCRRGWLKPRNEAQSIAMTQGTCMVGYLPTRSTRNPFTQL